MAWRRAGLRRSDRCRAAARRRLCGRLSPRRHTRVRASGESFLMKATTQQSLFQSQQTVVSLKATQLQNRVTP